MEKEVKEIATGYYEMKKSKFYCHIFSVFTSEDASLVKTQIASLYPKAKHIISAGIVGNKQFASEDGEVGRSAKKILFSLVKMKKENIVVLIARKFGGTLLGIGNVEKCFQASFEDAIKKL